MEEAKARCHSGIQHPLFRARWVMQTFTLMEVSKKTKIKEDKGREKQM